ERCRAHRAAGDWLERQREDNAVMLAEHFQRGDAPDRAVAWFRRAAEQALEGNDFRAALERIDRGMASGARDARRIDLLLLSVEAHKYLGEYAHALARCRDVMDVTRAGGDAWCDAVGEHVTLSGRLGDRTTCRVLARALLALDATMTPARTIAAARAVSVLRLYGMSADAEALEARLPRDAGELEQAGPIAASHVLSARGIRAAASGDPVGYLDISRTAVAALERI